MIPKPKWRKKQNELSKIETIRTLLDISHTTILPPQFDNFNTIYISEDWLIIYCFTSRSRIFHLYGDVTITGEGLQNLGLCSALRAFEQGGIFIVPHLLWHRASVFPVSSEGPPHSVFFYDTLGMWRIYSTPDPHRSPISRLLRHTRGCGGPILTRILTGSIPILIIRCAFWSGVFKQIVLPWLLGLSSEKRGGAKFNNNK